MNLLCLYLFFLLLFSGLSMAGPNFPGRVKRQPDAGIFPSLNNLPGLVLP